MSAMLMEGRHGRVVFTLFSIFISSTGLGVSKGSFLLQAFPYIGDDLKSVRARALFELSLDQPRGEGVGSCYIESPDHELCDVLSTPPSTARLGIISSSIDTSWCASWCAPSTRVSTSSRSSSREVCPEEEGMAPVTTEPLWGEA